MSDHTDNFKPTDPGPFQKYLFSGACYVQIGQCYNHVKQAVEQGRVLRDDQALLARFEALWKDYVLQQAAWATVPWPVSGQPGDTSDLNGPEIIYCEVEQAGASTMKKLIELLDLVDPDQLDLSRFFIEWASACDQAYAGMIRSEAFSRGMGETINNMMRLVLLDADSDREKSTVSDETAGRE